MTEKGRRDFCIECRKETEYLLQKKDIVKNIIVLFNSILHLGKILLYVFLIYVQCFILRRVYDVFFYFFHHHYNSMIAFYQYPITKRLQDISRRLLTPNSDTLSLPFGFILHKTVHRKVPVLLRLFARMLCLPVLNRLILPGFQLRSAVLNDVVDLSVIDGMQ